MRSVVFPHPRVGLLWSREGPGPTCRQLRPPWLKYQRKGKSVHINKIRYISTNSAKLINSICTYLRTIRRKGKKFINKFRKTYQQYLYFRTIRSVSTRQARSRPLPPAPIHRSMPQSSEVQTERHARGLAGTCKCVPYERRLR